MCLLLYADNAGEQLMSPRLLAGDFDKAVFRSGSGGWTADAKLIIPHRCFAYAS